MSKAETILDHGSQCQFSLRNMFVFVTGLTLLANVPRLFVAMPAPAGCGAWHTTMLAAGFATSVLLPTAIGLQMTKDHLRLRLWCLTALAISPIPSCVACSATFMHCP